MRIKDSITWIDDFPTDMKLEELDKPAQLISKDPTPGIGAQIWGLGVCGLLVAIIFIWYGFWRRSKLIPCRRGSDRKQIQIEVVPSSKIQTSELGAHLKSLIKQEEERLTEEDGNDQFKIKRTLEEEKNRLSVLYVLLEFRDFALEGRRITPAEEEFYFSLIQSMSTHYYKLQNLRRELSQLMQMEPGLPGGFEETERQMLLAEVFKEFEKHNEFFRGMADVVHQKRELAAIIPALQNSFERKISFTQQAESDHGYDDRSPLIQYN